MKLLLLSLFFITFPYIQKYEHDIHLSITDIKIESTEVNIKVKIFFDDLQNAMGLIPGEELPKKYKGADDLIYKYIQKNLKIKIDGNMITPIYIKSESAPPAIWASLKYETKGKNLNQLSIENSIMTSLFDDQMNMVNVYQNGEKKYFSLDKKNKLAIYNSNEK